MHMQIYNIYLLNKTKYFKLVNLQVFLSWLSEEKNYTTHNLTKPFFSRKLKLEFSIKWNEERSKSYGLYFLSKQFQYKDTYF